MNQNQKIKCICRLKENQFQQEILIDNQHQDTASLPEISSALQFLNAFAPEQLLRELTACEEKCCTGIPDRFCSDTSFSGIFYRFRLTFIEKYVKIVIYD